MSNVKEEDESSEGSSSENDDSRHTSLLSKSIFTAHPGGASIAKKSFAIQDMMAVSPAESSASEEDEEKEDEDEMSLKELPRKLELEELALGAEMDLADIFLCSSDDDDEEEEASTKKSKSGDAGAIADGEQPIRPDFLFGYNLASDEQETSDFTLLEPNHPQMRRFQEALRERHRLKNDEFVVRIMEITHELKKKRSEKDELAFHLHFLQTDLDRVRQAHEAQEEEIRSAVAKRLEEEKKLKILREKYERNLFDSECLRKKLTHVKTDLQNTTLKNVYLESEGQRVKDNITVTKMCVSKSKQVLAEAEEKQQGYDLWITKLSQKIENMEEDIALLEGNLEAQRLERNELNNDLSGATVEFQAVQMEMKQLTLTWNCMLIESQKKEETYNDVTDVYKNLKNDLKILTSDLEKLRKQLSAEQEASECAEEEFIKLNRRVGRHQKILISRQPEYRELRAKITKYQGVLLENGEALARTTLQRRKIAGKVSKLTKSYEHLLVERNSLKADIVQKIRDSKILGTISEKLAKQLLTVQHDTLMLEKELVTKENKVAKGFVKISKMLVVNKNIEKLLAKMTRKADLKDKALVAASEEMSRMDSLIKQKDALMITLQNKIDRLLALTGGQHVNPYELQLSNLNDTIERENALINEARKTWLADQAELVHMIKERDAEEDKIMQMRQETTLLMAKKMRIEGEIERDKLEMTQIAKRRRKMEMEICQIDGLIFKEKCNGDVSADEQKFSVNYFNATIREEQRTLIDMQDELEEVLKSKEEMIGELVEIEKQILIWEKKVHIAREMKATFMDRSWTEEMSSMKNEVWKMELRSGALRRETEKLHQTLERLAVKTVDLLSIDETSAKAKQKANLNRQINDLQDKVKQKGTELKHLERELLRTVDDGLRMQDEIFQREVEIMRMQNLVESMRRDIELMKAAKAKNLRDIVLSQNLSKDFEHALAKTQSPLWVASSSDLSKLNALKESRKFLKLMRELESHHPEASDEFKYIIDMYKSKLLDIVKQYAFEPTEED